MTKQPFFSVVTVTLNAKETLSATAESLRAQTFADYEWIVVDGGSDDDTIAVARRYLNSERDVLVSEPDNGLYDAMNKGLCLAKGIFVNFLNAGDLYVNADVLKTVHATSDDADVVYGDTIHTLTSGLTRYRHASPVATSIGHKIPFTHQAMFTRRDYHVLHPFDPSYRISADYAAIASMHMSGARMRHIGRPLNVNPIEGKAVSIRSRVTMAKEYRRIRREILHQPRHVAQWQYFKRRAHIAAVQFVEALPNRLVTRLLPTFIRERIY